MPFPEIAQYDDEYLEEQTILVKLGDTIRATVLVDGNVADSTTLPVGRPASENGLKAIRIGYINFIELPGLSPSLPPQPETTVDRINEDWAQVAIRFDLAGASTIDPVANVITVKNRAGTASADGTASVTVAPGQGTPTPVMINIFAGDTEEQIAQRLASEISNTVPGVTAQHYPHRTQNEDFWFVLVDKGNNVTFSNISSDPADVFIQPPALNYRDEDKIDFLAGNVLGLNFKDDDARTIDMFAVPNGALPGAYGRAGHDEHQFTLPGWQNTILIIESAVNGNDASNPLTAGHEVGHVLFDGLFDGSDPASPGHSPDPQNLMSVGSQGGELEDFREGKRLTNEQNEDARTDSATPTPVPLLHQTGHNE